MSRFDVLDGLVAEHNGYLTTAQVLKCGVSKPTLANFVAERGMERVAHGVYLARDAWKDSLYQLSLSNRGIVFSHESALHLHGLMEREPRAASVTVRAGYNATHLRRLGVRVYQTRDSVYSLGATELETTFGNIVRVYDVDRTVCDILRAKARMDAQVFRYAVREYMSGEAKDLNRLMCYARELRIEPLVRTYTEVLL